MKKNYIKIMLLIAIIFIPSFFAMGAVVINPEKDSTIKSDVYTFLAPLTKEKTAPTNIGDYFNWILTVGIGLCGVLAVVMFVIGGIQYMGDESIFGKTKGREQMFSALLGLLIALGSYALLNTINPNLLGAGGVNIKSVSGAISPTDTSSGSSTSLCISSTNPPNPASATGGTLTLNNKMTTEYIPTRDSLGFGTGVKLLITAQAAFEGFNTGTKSYRTNNPGNIGNTDSGATVTYKTLAEGVKKQQEIVANIANNTSPSYKIGSKPTCALGNEAYNGSLYQYLRIYATGARFDNNYLNAIIGYFNVNGKSITYKTTISEIYNMK